MTAILLDPPDSQGVRPFEQVFIRVFSIDGEIIHGRIAQQLNLVTNYKNGDPFDVKESEIRDWTIVDSQGKEEGNVVGKLLDHAQEQ